MSSPVPTEQQPLNEYLALKDSFFFRWATLATWPYLRVFLLVWLGWWLFTGPIAASSFPPHRGWFLFLAWGSLGATLGTLLPLLQLFLGWSYVGDRLNREQVLYEESGWYDGQTWQKPEGELIKDRLIVTYEIRPLLLKLKLTAMAILLILIVLAIAIWLGSQFF
ncbi:MAG: CGLD27 family protein [Pseudanabaenaceae cyanobacterium bins.68]|nr:CGLD27 family protein [Pseudanabaenaceae cyanobacterium bins.68]